MRDSHGETRPVLLSEQGFHSASYQPEDQNRQASSLWYAMRQGPNDAVDRIVLLSSLD